jgi:23S rRNA (adenine2503-C2)-methyltransferase
MMNLREFKSQTRASLLEWFQANGEPAYRADQLLRWAYAVGAESFDAMTDLPLALRQKLAAQFELNSVKALHTRHSADTTEKFLFQLRDGALIETVLIAATPGLTDTSNRHTLCISTQVGCAYGCKFCASGLDGVKRNLSSGEIVDQIVAAQRLMRKQAASTPAPATAAGNGSANLPSAHRPLAGSSGRVNNIVVMGMGEPLANYENLMRALEIINAPWGLGIGARKITISTVGLVPQIRKLAEHPLQLRLAVSLHGATDPVRGAIMPVNQKYPLKDLIEACEFYLKRRGRMMTFEYILIDGLNDSREQARQLAAIARRVRAKVNLIPCNPVEGLPWRQPPRDRQKSFQQLLRKAGIHATLRTEKGADIAAACGQLRLMREPSLHEPAAPPLPTETGLKPATACASSIEARQTKLEFL